MDNITHSGIMLNNSKPALTHYYRPDIDGLRAVAIFFVVLYHLGGGSSLAKGGFIGVDIFFVISGYLITKIIINDVRSNTFSIANFYERRARRILPALFVSVFASALIAFASLTPSELMIFARSAISATFFVANFYFMKLGGYFSPPPEALPLLHTWSLSVEEQFYLFFPLILAPVLRRKPSAAGAVFLVAAAISLGTSQVLLSLDPDAAFYMLAPRAWELLIGSLLALGVVPTVRSFFWREWLSAVAVLAIAAAAFGYNRNTPFPGVAALAPTLGAAVLIHAGHGRHTFTHRLLSSRPMVGLGLISYSLYLWHMPIIHFFKSHFSGLGFYQEKFLIFSISITVAALSWRYIEQPFRIRPGAIGRKSVFGLALLSTLSVVGICCFILFRDGMPERFRPEARRFATFSYEPEAFMRNGTCFIARRDYKAGTTFDYKTCLSAIPGEPNILIIGDSHAAHLWYGLQKAYPSANFLQATSSGCSSDLFKTGSDRCREVMANVFDFLVGAEKFDAAIFSMRWDGKGLGDVDLVLSKLKTVAHTVYVFGPIMRYTTELPRLLLRSAQTGDNSIVTAARVPDSIEIDKHLREEFRRRNVTYVSILDLLCGTGECPTVDGSGLPLQFDAGHLTATGSQMLAEKLGPVLGLTSERGQKIFAPPTQVEEHPLMTK